MLVQHSPQAKDKRSQRHQSILTPIEMATLDHTPSVHKLRPKEDLACWVAMKAFLKGLEVEWEELVEEEESEQTEVEGACEISEDEDLAYSDQPLVSQVESNFLKMMEKIPQLLGQLTQAISPSDNSKPPAFKTPSMKAPDSFDGTQAHKLRGHIQSYQLIFHNDPSNFFSEKKKVIYSTSFLTGRAGKLIEPYLSSISNQDPSYLLNNWQFFEAQLFTLFVDPNYFSKA
ncbi:hypothetical protein O181_020281 [Austropuccinia psidii MF-1]|uniref:Uncharacterized protein n=1 Tax=Austropuccinia psidii MF-1 TaxID=1389203 RepID=A0A9Q3GUP0_9BASI|nr:hypothetical protein [Austropuccinia psidii MF-1]